MRAPWRTRHAQAIRQLVCGPYRSRNVGYGGTPVNDRRYPQRQLVTVFDKAEAMAKLMDRLGYGTFWMAEHHFQPEGYECIPNVLMMALHLTHVTKRLQASAAASTSRRCGIRCAWPRTMRWRTS